MTHPALHDHTQRESVLKSWVAYGWLRPLDKAFADFLYQENPQAHPLLILTAALVSHQLGRGHVCCDMARTLQSPNKALALPPENAVYAAIEKMPATPDALLENLSLSEWQSALADATLINHGKGATPLVLVETRVYLRRYWQHEQDVIENIQKRLANPFDLSRQTQTISSTLNTLFPNTGKKGAANWQKRACALVLPHRFSIITGGPGTGKTTTIIRLMSLLQTLALEENAATPLRIKLAAPTGKAASRLSASLSQNLASLPQGETVKNTLPTNAQTLHRLLGSQTHSRHFRHNASNPLAVDVLIIDEASMVDLEMMTAVITALPPDARLILLGDMDQLASVEAGAILGELTKNARLGRYTPDTAKWLEDVCGEKIEDALIDEAGNQLDQAITMLRHSFRFAENSGIQQLAEATNMGDAARFQDIYARSHEDIQKIHIDKTANFFHFSLTGTAEEKTIGQATFGYQHYLRHLHAHQPHTNAPQSAFDSWAKSVLEAHQQFQILCVTRQGEWGVEQLNKRIAYGLFQKGLIARHEGWYIGRPVMVTQNDYSTGLMNGDIGITLTRPDTQTKETSLCVAFSSHDGSSDIKWFSPHRLSAIESVFALTVHKSQGSEFTHSALVLPDTPSPILNRALIYTAITRAVKYFTLIETGDKSVIKNAIESATEREGGLGSAINQGKLKV